jgi:hypothetical protein
MPLGNRLHRLVIRGCLIAGVVLLTAGVGPCEAKPPDQLAETTSRNPSPADSAKVPPPGPPKALAIDRIEAALNRIVTALEAEFTKPESADDRRRAEGDLDAQQSMAWWTPWIFIAAVFQAIFTYFGIRYVRVQLILTRRAVEDTRDASLATIRALEHERRKSRRELRAYVSISPGQIRFSNGLYIRIVQKNSGQTPARNVRLWARAFIRNTKIRKDFAFPKCPRVGGTVTIQPDQEYIIQAKVDDTNKDTVFFNVTSDYAKSKVFIFTESTYTDYTGRDRVTCAC